MHAALRTGLLLIFSLATFGAASCDQAPSTGEGRVWTISTEPGRDGPRLTLKTDCRAEDQATGRSTPLELQVRTDATPAWGANPAAQEVTIRLVSIGGPAIPEQTLSFQIDGGKRADFGQGRTASETRQTAQGLVTCPTFVATGPAAAVRTLVGSRSVVGTVGGFEFRLDDARIRGLAELLRRTDGALPR